MTNRKKEKNNRKETKNHQTNGRQRDNMITKTQKTDKGQGSSPPAVALGSIPTRPFAARFPLSRSVRMTRGHSATKIIWDKKENCKEDNRNKIIREANKNKILQRDHEDTKYNGRDLTWPQETKIRTKWPQTQNHLKEFLKWDGKTSTKKHRSDSKQVLSSAVVFFCLFQSEELWQTGRGLQGVEGLTPWFDSLVWLLGRVKLLNLKSFKVYS